MTKTLFFQNDFLGNKLTMNFIIDLLPKKLKWQEDKMKPTLMESIKKFLIERKILKKKAKPTMSPKEFEALEKQFLMVRSRFSSTEGMDIDNQLQSLTTKEPTMRRTLDFISILADALENKKDEPPKWITELNEFWKSADFSTLIQEFNNTHLAMMFALNEKLQIAFETQRHYIAIEIANRMGGTDFVLALDIALQNNTESEKI